MSRNGWQQLGDDAASVAPSKGVSDISGIELGSALGEQHQVRSGRHMSRARVPQINNIQTCVGAENARYPPTRRRIVPRVLELAQYREFWN